MRAMTTTTTTDLARRRRRPRRFAEVAEPPQSHIRWLNMWIFLYQPSPSLFLLSKPSLLLPALGGEARSSDGWGLSGHEEGARSQRRRGCRWG
jgi:hypothetical protein